MSKVSGWFNKKLKRSSGQSHAEEQASQEQHHDPNISEEGSLETPNSFEQHSEQHYHEKEVAIDDDEIEIHHEPTPEPDHGQNMAQFEKKKEKKEGGMFSKFRKKKASAPPAEPHPEQEHEMQETHYHEEPEPSQHQQPVVQQPPYSYNLPQPEMTVQRRGITKRQREQQEAMREEAIGMNYMRQYQDRVRRERQSVMMPGYGASAFLVRAPGFDYANWKPRGKVRYDYGGVDYNRMASALAPYVRCVVVSGCEGAEERRWAALTESAETNSRPLQSRVASRDVL